MDLYEHYYPMSAFETAIREIYFRHAPILKGGLSAYTSQQLVNLREDMLPDIQALARQGKGFYQHPKPEALAEVRCFHRIAILSTLRPGSLAHKPVL